MASAASGHPASAVLWDMPLAQAFQFAAAWLETQGNPTRPACTSLVDSGTFAKIANR